mmetsp:Transcript_35452/g.43353  ORF Transcript_35452/g.43353 Transcript_35452/m.43353 type:complete len:247 (-) Transcript_35452:1660-2400(-)
MLRLFEVALAGLNNLRLFTTLAVKGIHASFELPREIPSRVTLLLFVFFGLLRWLFERGFGPESGSLLGLLPFFHFGQLLLELLSEGLLGTTSWSSLCLVDTARLLKVATCFSKLLSKRLLRGGAISWCWCRSRRWSSTTTGRCGRSRGTTRSSRGSRHSSTSLRRRRRPGVATTSWPSRRCRRWTLRLGQSLHEVLISLRMLKQVHSSLYSGAVKLLLRDHPVMLRFLETLTQTVALLFSVLDSVA